MKQIENESVCVCVCVCDREAERKMYLYAAFAVYFQRIQLFIGAFRNVTGGGWRSDWAGLFFN